MKVVKKNLGLNLLIILIITLSSCIRIGIWDDNIHLSTKAVEFKAAGDSVMIKTEGSTWGVSDVSVDDKWYYGFPGVDLQTNSYSIKQDGFVVERRDNHTLFIKVEKNPLNVQRIITVGLGAGDYFDRVIITQKPRI